MVKYSLTITHLYPRTMSTYGDTGNIKVLIKRCLWRNIDLNLYHSDINDKYIQEGDIYFWGGGQDISQEIVSKSLSKDKIDFLRSESMSGKVMLLVCGGYQLMGKHYETIDGKIVEGFSILNIFTKASKKRMIGNVVLRLNAKLNLGIDTLIGFENHSGKTYLSRDVEPLGFVEYGFGNNGEDKTEGAVFKNTIGCYQHGPLLPKNPHLADHLIKMALENKYKEKMDLKSLDDKIEWNAHTYLLKKIH